ncbi:MAG: hypothetical protein U5R49_26410 [Deltaproteobacteria bacterium]|nr:hypothetical protein [Deltaproteobacteria bacterium]
MTTTALSKREIRERSAQLRALMCEWDPIGVRSDPNWSRDEYDCLVGPLLTLLIQRASEEQIAQYLRKETTEHFGLSPNNYDFPEAARRVRRWFDHGWRGVGEPVTIFVALWTRGSMSGVPFERDRSIADTTGLLEWKRIQVTRLGSFPRERSWSA